MKHPPGVPQAVETSTTAISLSWQPSVCAIHSQVSVAVEYIVHYELQMQQVRASRHLVEGVAFSPALGNGNIGSQGIVGPLLRLAHHTMRLRLQVDDKGALHSDRWSAQYTGTASFVQVKGLRPGRSYAARVTAVPQVINMPEAVVVASPPSDIMLVQTLPCPPMGQSAPQLASRMKKELKVGGDGHIRSGCGAGLYSGTACLAHTHSSAQAGFAVQHGTPAWPHHPLACSSSGLSQRSLAAGPWSMCCKCVGVGLR